MEKVGVEGVDVENGRVCGVRTTEGDIKCKIFINCAGQVMQYLWVMQLPVGDVATLVVAASDLSALLAWGLHETDVGFAPRGVKL